MMTKEPSRKADGKRERSRKGYVMVELEATERAQLERLRDELEARFGARKVGLAGAFRWLLREHQRRR
jgi:hypothetical protein